jgi:hypothetical protein
MIRARQRGGPRSLLKRRPKAARTRLNIAAPNNFKPERAPASRTGESVEDADRRLRNYRKHFIEGTESETYFRATRAIVTAARRWRDEHSSGGMDGGAYPFDRSARASRHDAK